MSRLDELDWRTLPKLHHPPFCHAIACSKLESQDIRASKAALNYHSLHLDPMTSVPANHLPWTWAKWVRATGAVGWRITSRIDFWLGIGKDCTQKKSSRRGSVAVGRASYFRFCPKTGLLNGWLYRQPKIGYP